MFKSGVAKNRKKSRNRTFYFQKCLLFVGRFTNAAVVPVFLTRLIVRWYIFFRLTGPNKKNCNLSRPSRLRREKNACRIESAEALSVVGSSSPVPKRSYPNMAKRALINGFLSRFNALYARCSVKCYAPGDT